MTKKKAVLNKKKKHQLVKRKSLANNQLYNKFLNWISGEFDLYLQEEQNGLNVFFPGGKFNINKVTELKNDIVIEINVESKNLSQTKSITNKIISIHKHLDDMY
ncbi:hypothetical protein [Pontimicrobium sp. MEBiC01747]